jgi:hypothetical protein
MSLAAESEDSLSRHPTLVLPTPETGSLHALSESRHPGVGDRQQNGSIHLCWMCTSQAAESEDPLSRHLTLVPSRRKTERWPHRRSTDHG